jgi:large subunit ribosomal protein L21
MYAIVASGGKQHKVAAGDIITVEKLSADAGQSVKLDAIFLANEDQIVTDPAELASVTVTGEVLEHFKGEKAIIFKFKKRKGYKRLKGHRQELTKVKITDVTTGAAPKKTTRKKKTEAPVEVAVEASEDSAQE